MKISILKEIQEIKECQIRMEINLAHHISRTDMLQKLLEPIHRTYTSLKWVLGAVGTLGIVAGSILTVIKILN